MAAIRHLGLWRKRVFVPSRTLRDPIIYVHTKFGEDSLIGGGDVPPKRSSKKRPLVAEFYFRFQL